MNRILIIDRCDDCKYANIVKLTCSHSIVCFNPELKGVHIHPYFIIPTWCPLPVVRNVNKVKGVKNCQTCIDCQRMVSPDGISWRCYGQRDYGELKRDICDGEKPPEVAPDWCPHRN